MLLKINNLKKEYIRNGESFYAVNDISIEAKKGELIVIIGHSGSGKSTLLNLITGMLRPSSGEIFIDGDNIVSKSSLELSLLRNTVIGYVMQGQSLLSNFTVKDNICMPSYISKNKKDVLSKALELLEDVGLSSMRDSYPSSLSGGEMRRVTIARAMINNPKLIIADEPTSDLDPYNSKKIMDFFKEVTKKGTTVLVSTHDMNFVNYADKLYCVENGTISNKDIEKSFL